jgi:hypothetical protein
MPPMTNYTATLRTRTRDGKHRRAAFLFVPDHMVDALERELMAEDDVLAFTAYARKTDEHV